MSTISLRINEEENKLIQEYVAINNLNLSAFIRETILEKIEEDLNLDEERILNSLQKIEEEKSFNHTEVWDRLGV